MFTHLLAGLIVTVVSVGDAKLATPEEVSLQSAARDYRIQVYNTFRTDRPEFDRRHEQWVRLIDAWRGADKPNHDVPALLHWLEVATANSQPDSISPLPELPRIVATHSSRRNGSAKQTILQRLATDKLKSATRSATTAKSSEKNAELQLSTEDSTGSESSASKATPVSATSRRSHDIEEDGPAASETAPVPGSESAAPAANGDEASTGSNVNAELYQAYGERLGNCLGTFAAGLVRKHDKQNASHHSDGNRNGQQSPAPND